MSDKWRAWLSEDLSGMEDFLQTDTAPDISRKQLVEERKIWRSRVRHDVETEILRANAQRDFRRAYRLVAVVSCVVFIGIMLYMVSRMPTFGMDNPRADVVAQRYIEQGLEETGAVNIVAAMILDYRAFDTLGESFVLFTALLCSTVLLRLGEKNTRREREDYYTVMTDSFFDTASDSILRRVGLYLVPCILLFGIYILLNGHLSPGGGFSGGAILGAALIILSSSLGFQTADRILTYKRLNLLSFVALGFYALSKCYVFFTGANHLHNGIPKGTPGAIFSAGLILPLNIAVGLVVACTMYGFYSLFRRGRIGDA